MPWIIAHIEIPDATIQRTLTNMLGVKSNTVVSHLIRLETDGPSAEQWLTRFGCEGTVPIGSKDTLRKLRAACEMAQENPKHAHMLLPSEGDYDDLPYLITRLTDVIENSSLDSALFFVEWD